VVGSSARRMVKLPLLERAGISALVSGIARGFTNATLHPIDTVKTKLQTRGAS
jgi:solute carrier family 25 S-adenosylmethionine transporter 26